LNHQIGGQRDRHILLFALQLRMFGGGQYFIQNGAVNALAL